MKFDSSAMQVLKNFSAINQNILFRSGNVIRTIAPSKGLIAKATLSESIPTEFGINELSRFLGTMSLFKDPNLDIQDQFVEISEGTNKFRYVVAPSNVLDVAPDKDIVIPDPEIKFTLTEDALTRVLKALSVATLPNIAVVSDGSEILLQAMDADGKTKDTFSVAVGMTSASFKMIFRADNIKLINGDYSVAISSKGISHFRGTNVEYWIAVESNSTYQG